MRNGIRNRFELLNMLRKKILKYIFQVGMLLAAFTLSLFYFHIYQEKELLSCFSPQKPATATGRARVELQLVSRAEKFKPGLPLERQDPNHMSHHHYPPGSALIGWWRQQPEPSVQLRWEMAELGN